MEEFRDLAHIKTVVHLVPAMEQGGVERVVCDLNRALVRAGWRSVVVSRGGRLVSQIVADGGEHVALDLKSKNPLTCLTRAWKLRRVIRGIARDARLVVCAHSRVPAWLYVGARKIDTIFGSCRSVARVPWVTYAHGANSVSRYSAVMTRGDRVVVPSKFLKGFLVENYADEGSSASKTGTRGAAMPLRDRIRVICPAVDLARFDPAKVDAAVVAALRREWGVEDGARVVMSIGRITAVKGFDNVIRAFAEQTPESEVEKWKSGKVEKFGGDKLVVVGGVDKGKEPLLASLKRLASDLGVADRVVFAGARDCMPECLAIADEVVSGNVTKPESFGLSVAEALAMNKKVRLLKKFGGAGEILDEVENRKGGKAETGDGTREAIRAMCDLDVMAKKTIEVYDEVCDERRHR